MIDEAIPCHCNWLRLAACTQYDTKLVFHRDEMVVFNVFESNPAPLLRCFRRAVRGLFFASRPPSETSIALRRECAGGLFCLWRVGSEGAYNVSNKQTYLYQRSRRAAERSPGYGSLLEKAGVSGLCEAAERAVHDSFGRTRSSDERWRRR